MPNPESQFVPEEFKRRGGETARERYGPDWTRDIGEPMVCRYLEDTFPSFVRVHWVQELPNSLRLDRAGVDGVVALQDEHNDEPPQFLAIQVSTAALHEQHGRGVWMKKFAAWKRSPTIRVNGEAEAIGAREGDEMPVVFVHVDHADLDSAWEKTPHGDWRDPDAKEIARDAAQNLPQSPQFQKRIVDAMWLSLERIREERKDLRGVLEPHRMVILGERQRVEEERRRY